MKVVREIKKWGNEEKTSWRRERKLMEAEGKRAYGH